MTPAKQPELVPQSETVDPQPLLITETGQWLVLNDVHLPHHDNQTLRAAHREAKSKAVAGILLNGDIVDCGSISRHDRHSSNAKLSDEIDLGNRFLTNLRSEFPKARIIFKAGNHEERLDRYILTKAPELEGLKGFDLPSLLHLHDRGVEWVQDGRAIHLGKIVVFHGHEYRGGGGVNVARWLHLQADECCMCGHFHRTSEHHSRDAKRYNSATYSIGCACNLYPHYAPQNKWNHGYAMVDIQQGGDFYVINRRMINGVAAGAD